MLFGVLLASLSATHKLRAMGGTMVDLGQSCEGAAENPVSGRRIARTPSTVTNFSVLRACGLYERGREHHSVLPTKVLRTFLIGRVSISQVRLWYGDSVLSWTV